MTDAEIFFRALRAADRGAALRWLKARRELGLDVQAHKKISVLLDPELTRICRRAAISAISTSVAPAIKYTVWSKGVTIVDGGITAESSVEGLAALLEERAKIVASKGDGWVITPTTNATGRRDNASTKKLHALFLDADGTGSFVVLRAVLQALDLAHVLYESGGSSTETPKWRCILPLVREFDVSTEERQSAWKTAYGRARIVFGSLGGLKGCGFDPATDTPCNPWFLTEQRSADDAPRRVLWSLGNALDLEALVAACPRETVVAAEPASRARPTRTARSLTADVQTALIDRLAEATASVPTGRHDLYLALPGALLDRGVDPDDVYDIIEEVSERYPRPHPEHHADNLHGAETTIKKFLKGEQYTRIGTVQERWPEVARAIDVVLPDPIIQSARKFLASLSGETTSTPAPAVVDGSQQQHQSTPQETWDVAKVKAKISVAKRKKFERGQEHEDEGEIVKGVLLRRFVDGDKLIDDDDPESLRDLAPEQAVAKIGGMLAYTLPLGVPSSIIVKIGWVSLSKMVSDEATLGDFTAWLAATYERGVGTRLEEEAKSRVAVKRFFDNFPEISEDEI